MIVYVTTRDLNLGNSDAAWNRFLWKTLASGKNGEKKWSQETQKTKKCSNGAHAEPPKMITRVSKKSLSYNAMEVLDSMLTQQSRTSITWKA
jgi:hypothetical protein